MADRRLNGRNFSERRAHRLLTSTEFDYILDAVVKYYRVSKDRLYTKFKGNWSDKSEYRARQVAMYICWNSYDTSYEAVATYFEQNKVTAFKAAIQVEEWRHDDKQLDQFITRVENAIIQRRCRS